MLKPEVSIPVALATAAVVYGVYNVALPSFADSRMAAPDDSNLAAAENNALFLGVAACAGISILAKDVTPFVYGGLTAVLLSWSHRWHKAVNPSTGKLDTVVGQMGSNLKAVSTVGAA